MEKDRLAPEIESVRRAIDMAAGLKSMAETHRHWEVPLENLEEVIHVLTAHFGALCLQRDAEKEWKGIPDA